MGRQAFDLTGQTFGRLRVLRRDGTYRTKKNYTHVKWRCLCDPALGGCGRETTVIVSNLRNGHTTRCGCYAREYQQSRGQKRKEYGKKETDGKA